MNTEIIRELEKKIEELRSRLPAHSIPPAMFQELEDMEDQLEKARAVHKEG